jgi:hypothetical protein
MNGVTWSWYIEQSCQQIDFVSHLHIVRLFYDRKSIEGAIKTITGTKNDLVFLYLILYSIQLQASHGTGHAMLI